MWKLLTTSIAFGASGAIALGFTLATPLAALADKYDDFIKTQVAEFQSNAPENCKERKQEETRDGNTVTYELCIVKNSPVYLRTSLDGAPGSLSYFKQGKLVGIIYEAQGGVGFRNEKPVVEWNPGEFGTRKVNWKLSATEKANFSGIATNEKKILRKFGFR